MRRLLVSQRVDVASSTGERRDAVDQNWTRFLLKSSIFPIFLPNNLEYVQRVIHELEFDGVLSTGGNSLEKYGGDAPERDEVERFLLEWCVSREAPFLGVCRGMQVIQDFYGIELHTVARHVNTRHQLELTGDGRLTALLRGRYDVNNYHDFGSAKTNEELTTVAVAEDGIIMALEHKELPIFGVMWHCERESPFCIEDENLFHYVFPVP